MDRNKLKNTYGFKEMPHFTINNSLILDIGRNRSISIGCFEEPNEMVVIKEHDREDYKKVTDLVCLHNYDYDGYLTEEKLICLLKGLGTLKL